MSRAEIVKHVFLHRYGKEEDRPQHWDNFLKAVKKTPTRELNEIPALTMKYEGEISDEWKRRAWLGDPDTLPHNMHSRDR